MDEINFYPIADTSYAPKWDPYDLACTLLSGGAKFLQLRQKKWSEQKFLEVAQEISYLKIHNSFSFIINSHLEVVKKVDADGVHLPSNSHSITEARKFLGPKKIIGVSVHSLDEGIAKAKEGADYLTLGAIFPTKKEDPNHPLVGLETLKKLTDLVSIPVVGIGGIGFDNWEEVLKNGAKGFCMMSSIYEGDIQKNIERTKNIFL